MKTKPLIICVAALTATSVLQIFAMLYLRNQLVKAREVTMLDRVNEFGTGVHCGFAATLKEIEHFQKAHPGPVNSSWLSEQRIFNTAFGYRADNPILPAFPDGVQIVLVPPGEKKATP